MKNIHWMLSACCAVFTWLAGSAWGSAQTPPVRILPIGDSLTEGLSNYSVPGAYRNRLHTLLTNAGYNVDFVGTFADTNNPTLPDTQHQGLGGARIDEIQPNLQTWFNGIEDPDVVLLLVGTNDFWQNHDLPNIQTRLGNLIADIATRRPYAKVIVGGLPLRTDNAGINAQQIEFSNSIPGIVAQQVALGRQVTFVNLYNAWTAGDLSPDGVHPTATGFQKLGNALFPAITQVISPQGTANPPLISRIGAGATPTTLPVVFSKPVSDASSSLANFSVSNGLSITRAELDPTKRIITLTTSPQVAGLLYTLSVSGVTDRTAAQTPIAPQSMVFFSSNPISNGSFENDLAGWSTTGNVAIKTTPTYVATDGAKVLAFNTDQTTPNGTVSQTFNTTPGQTYQLFFDMGVLSFNTNEQRMQVTVVGSSSLVNDTITLRGQGAGSNRWLARSYTFTANSTSTTLTFRDVSTTSASIDLILDGVRIGEQAARTLTVTSTPLAGAPMTLVPADFSGTSNGSTGLIRAYNNGTAVTVTAPVAHNGANFLRWQRNGVDLLGTTPSISVNLNQNVALNAIYGSNNTPSASPDNYAAAANSTLTVVAPGVLTNDNDPDGTALGAVINAGPLNGSLTLNPNGGFTYTPNPGYEGTDTFTYRASDSVSQSAVATVTLNVGGGSNQALVNGSFEADLTGWTSSGNTAVRSDTPPYTPTNGAKLMGFNTGQSAPNGLISQTFATVPGNVYQLNFDVGAYGFNTNAQRLQTTVTGTSALIAQTVTVNGIGGGNTRWIPQSFSFTANSATTTLSFRDVSSTSNGIDLVLDNVRVTSAPVSHVVTISSSPASGLAIGCSPGDVNGNTTGISTFTRTYHEGTIVNLSAPAVSTSSTSAFVKWQKDGVDFSNNRNISISVSAATNLTAHYGNNTAPSATPENYTTPVNTALSVAAPGVLANDSDAEANPVTALVGTNPGNGVLVLNPDGAFTYTPDNGFTGQDSFTYLASDGILNSTPVTVTIEVLGVTPGTVANGSFELGETGWTASGNRIVVSSAAPYLATDGTKLMVFNGNQRTPNAVISQSLATVPGQSYVLDFDMGIVGATSLSQSLRVAVTGSSSLVLRNETIQGAGATSTRWVAKSYSFIANSAETTITFSDISSTTNNVDLLIDHVRLSTGSARVLTVGSSPDGGVNVTVTPADKNGQDNGTTGFTRVYDEGSEVTLTAPASHADGGFLKWTKNGADHVTTPATTFTMDGNVEFSAIYAVNTAPAANPDTATTERGQPLVVTAPGLLSNDADAESHPLSAVLASGPANGTLVLTPDGGFTYTPDTGFSGTDTFTYRANDGFSDSAPATVTITVNDFAPGTLVNGSFENGETGWTITGNRFVIDKTSAYHATDGDKLLVFNGGQLPANGVASQSFATTIGQTYFVNLDMGVVGASSFTQRLEVKVTGSNPATPLVSSMETLSGAGGSTTNKAAKSYSFVADSATSTLILSDKSTVHLNGDLIVDNVRVTLRSERVLTVNSSPESAVTITISPNDLNSSGNGPTPLSRTYQNGAIVTLTAPATAGAAEFMGWTRNGAPFGSSTTVNVTMDNNQTLTALYGINLPPIAGDDSHSTGLDTPLAVTAPGVLANDSDPDGTPITAVLATGPSNGTLTLYPDGSFNYIPDSGFSGQDSFTYRASDGVLQSAPATVTINVQSVAPGALVNGSFEDGETGWTITGNRFVIDGAGAYSSTDGRKLMVFNGGQLVPNAVISQTFATIPGQTYLLEFDMGIVGSTSTSQRLQITVAGSSTLLSRLETITGTGTTAAAWSPRSFSFVANSAATTLSFTDASASTNSVDLLLDSVCVRPAGTHVLTLASTMGAGQILTVSPPDRSGNGDGSTRFKRYFNAGNSVTVGAPANVNGRNFLTWRRNDVDFSPDPVTTLTMDGDHTLTAVYAEPPQLLVNGSFEDDYSGWTKTGNQEIKPTSSAYPATDGVKLASFNTGQLPGNGVLSQAFATIPGQSYDLSFDLGILSFNTSTQRMLVSATGAGTLLSQTINLQGVSGGASRWFPQAFSFVADSTTTTLTFRDQSPATSNIDMMLDKVRVSGLSVSRTLTIDSNPGGVSIAASPADEDDLSAGTTPFTLAYPGGANITLTAPASHEGVPFSKWTKNGQNFSTSPVATIPVDGDHTFTAIYLPNTPPIAVADSYSGPSNSAIVVNAAGVLANDTDAENNPLTAVLVSGPAHGSLTLNPNGGFTYTPDPEFQGSDSFTYRADDGKAQSPETTVTIEITAVVPGTLVNGSFEDGETGWTMTGNRIVHTLPSGSITPDGTKVLYFNTSQQSPNAVVTQSFFTVPGTPYTLNYEMGTTGATASQQRLQCTVVGATTLVNQTEVMNGGGSSVVWQSKSHSFVADSTLTTLTFRDVSTTSHNIDMLLDHVRLDSDANRSLAVTSNTANPIAVIITPADNASQSGGETPVSRNYAFNTTVTLTAPATSGSFPFVKWQKNGSDHGFTPATSVVMDGNITMTAVYNVPAPANLVTNGSFENNLVGWTNTGSMEIQTTTPYTATEGTRLLTFNSSGGPNTGMISQTFATTAGATYNLTFDAGVLAYNSNMQQLRVEVSGTGSLLSQTIPLSRTSGPNMRWTPQNLSFVANSSTTTLRFSDASSTTSGIDLALDNIRVLLNTSAPLLRALTVESSPVSADITISPNDSLGNGSGTTRFGRSYENGTFVTLTAPQSSNGVNFLRWRKNGVDASTDRTVSLTMDANHTMTAVYADPPFSNGSFETGNFSPWTTSGGTSDSVKINSIIGGTDGIRIVEFNSANSPAGGILSQSFATTPGITYSLGFDLGVMAFNTSSQTMRVQVSGNGSLLNQTTSIAGIGSGRVKWEARTFSFTANSTTTVLTLTDISTVTSSIDMLLDNVRVTNANARTLTVNSVAVSTLPVTVSPADNGAYTNGTTTLNREYNLGTVVSLDVPATAANGATFVKWVRDGQDHATTPATTVTISAHTAMFAIYSGGTNPPLGPNLIRNGSFELSPDFLHWATSGATRLEKPGPDYTTDGRNLLSFNVGGTGFDGVAEQSFPTVFGTTYTLQFDPGVFGGAEVDQRLKFEVIGNGTLLNRTVTIRGSSAGFVWAPQTHTFTANSSSTIIRFSDNSTTGAGTDLFVDNVRVREGVLAPSTLTVNSTPAPGQAITVNTPDMAGQTNGTTQFVRTYSTGQTIQMVAPHQNFVKWLKNGDWYATNPTINLVMDGSHTMTAVYTETPVPGPFRNGGFEDEFAGWTWTGSQQSVKVKDGLPTTEGIYVIEFNSNNSATDGAIHQTFNTTPGTTYTLAFDMGTLAYNTAQQRLQVTAVGANNTTLLNQTYSINGTGGGNTVWAGRTASFTANSTTTRLSFFDRSSTGGGLDLLLDNVRINGSTGSSGGSRTLTVNSTPSSGAAITINPADNNAQANGVTPLSRSYNDGTTVSLTAPASHNGNAFIRWQRNGTDAGTSRTLSVNMDLSQTLTAVYEGSASSVSLVNGSFENNLTGWSSTGSTNSVVAASDVAGTNGTTIVKFNSSNSPSDGAVSQTITTVAGTTYTATFDMGVIAFNTNQQRLQVSATGTGTLNTQTFTINGVGSGTVRWNTRSITFTADSASTTLAFRDVSTTGTGLDLLLDHVRIATGTFAPGPNLVTNGGFDLTPDQAGWTQAGSIRLEKPGSSFTTSGNNILSFNVGGASAGGTVSQSFATIPGALYELNFDVGTLGNNTNQQRLRTTVTGSGPLLSQVSTVTCRADFVMVWVHQTFSFMANSTSTTLTFTDISTTTSGLDLFVDTVAINQIAAPAATSPAPSALPPADDGMMEAEPSIAASSAGGDASQPGNLLPGTPVITKVPDGFTITLTVNEPGLYFLERCDDLRSWQPHGQIEVSEPATIEFHDNQTGNDRMFYRIGRQTPHGK